MKQTVSFATLLVLLAMFNTNQLQSATRAPTEETKGEAEEVVDTSKTMKADAQVVDVADDEDPFEGLNLDEGKTGDDDAEIATDADAEMGSDEEYASDESASDEE